MCPHFAQVSVNTHGFVCSERMLIEVLGVCLVLLFVVLWAIFTSIPQPIFAIPAYLFIEKFAPMLPVGLGFAAGAMAYVACFELFGEAMEDLQSVSLTGAMTVVAFASMILLQGVVKDIHYVP